MDNIQPRKVLETYLLAKPAKVIDMISPSQLGKCHRAHWLKIHHIEPLIKPTAAKLANFEVGFLWEELMRRALEAQDILFDYQTKFLDPELNMSGSSDFIVGDPMVKATMWDTKTMASKWFWYQKAKKKRADYDWWDENYGYIIQQGAYLLMAERRGYKLDKAVLVFISKDDGFIGDVLEVFLTKKLRAELKRLIDEMNNYLGLDQLPPCTCEGWLTGYCDYGNPNTMELNKTKKLVSTECCGSLEDIEDWRIKSLTK